MPEAKKDFFISYASKDERWAEWIAWQLESDGYSVFLQAWDFLPSSNFVLEMQKGTAEAERTVAVLSQAFLESHFTQPEWAAAFAQDPTGEKGMLLPIRIGECDPKGLLPQIVYVDLVGLEEDAARHRVLAAARRERAKPKKAPGFPGAAAAAQPSFPGGLPPIWNVPHRRNPNFTGREDLLTALRDKLTSGEHAALTQAIAGLGGVGKTQLATEYAYRHASDYGLIWWVRSEEAAQLASDYAGLATPLGLPEKDAQEQQQAIDAVCRWLEHNTGWLLVFDNVPAPQDVRDYLPKGGGGHVIITSRHAAWGGVASPLSVQVWPRDESVDFLLKRTGLDDQNAAAALANELGDLPLALEQAAAYMDATGCSMAEYLRVFGEHQKELMAKGSESSQYPFTVATTWDLAFQRLEDESPEAADLLNLCAFFAPDDIPLDVISDGAEHLPERLATAAKDDMAWNDALAALRRYSLAEVAGDALSVHRLVQAVTCGRLDTDATRTCAEAAVKVVNSAYPPGDIQDQPQAWPACERLLSHALAAAARTEQLEVAPETAGHLLNQIGLYLQERGQFDDAKAAHHRALRTAERTYGPHHPTVASAANNLGTVVRALGDPAGARPHFERALRIDEETYGPDYPEVATAVNNLGLVLEDLGDLAGAQAHFQRALRIHEKAYGPDHPNVARSVNNLGSLLQALGELEPARAHFERALRIVEKAYGPDHPNVGMPLGNLAKVLAQLGELREARELVERALAIHEKSYGGDHPIVATSASILGSVLNQLGDLPGARAHFERALRIDEQVYGPDHPDVAIDLAHLGNVVSGLGDLAGARAHFERALLIDEGVYGPDHPEVATDVNNLGSVLHAQGDIAGARDHFERALAVLRKVLGDDHPNVVMVRKNLESLDG